MNNKNNKDTREIQIAKIAFIGATIATIGDGIAAYAAALTVDLLLNPESNTNTNTNTNTRSSVNNELESNKAQIDYYINELIQIRNSLETH